MAGRKCARSVTIAILCSMTCSMMAGCLTTEQMAPSVGSRFQDIAVQQGVQLALLQEGRDVYLTDCVRCHGVEPIGRYSTDRWYKVLPRMARETKLDDRQTAALTAYVLAAHEVLRQMERNN